QGNGGAAVNEFKKAIAIKPENVPASLKLADHYKRRGDLAGCLEVLKNLLESYPDSEALKIQVASLSLENKQPEVARKFYQEILQDNPRNPEALKGLSVANLQIGHALKNEGTLQSKESAKEFLTEALQANPDNLTAALRQQRLETKAPSFSPQKPAPFLPLGNQPSDSLKRGQVYWENNQFQRANQAFEIALLGYPRPEDALLLGEIFKEQGHLAMAEKAFRLVFDQSAPNTPFHQAALKGIQDAEKNKRTAQGLITEAQQHLKERLPQRAIQLIQESLEIHRLNPEAHRLLGEAFEKNLQPSMAIAAYQHYLDLEPSLEARKKVQRHLEQLEKK
ncbi:MAG: tetratricopeptide repeat protein, partial [Cyanobacteria bacterium]|nr:tetratricopeptide repeat protein [Cyanobacteriota bacterium]